uniref:Uncharacterized protein MANES_15G082400 n=1 Tax=Rhizophora mucronata TaxID=61149 RepID=A0A2P2KVB1_RHIMU
MAIADRQRQHGDVKLFRLCPFWQTSGSNNSSCSSSQQLNGRHWEGSGSSSSSAKTMSSVARSLLPARRRLRLDPPNHLYFTYEPGKQVKSAVRLKNTSRSHVAFKFQTTAPKSCYMRPPGGILAPGESLIATGNLLMAIPLFIFVFRKCYILTGTKFDFDGQCSSLWSSQRTMTNN